MQFLRSLALATLCFASTGALADRAVGFGSGATGGSSAICEATTEASLRACLESPEPYTVRVKGVIVVTAPLLARPVRR